MPADDFDRAKMVQDLARELGELNESCGILKARLLSGAPLKLPWLITPPAVEARQALRRTRKLISEMIGRLTLTIDLDVDGPDDRDVLDRRPDLGKDPE